MINHQTVDLLTMYVYVYFRRTGTSYSIAKLSFELLSVYHELKSMSIHFMKKISTSEIPDVLSHLS